MLRVLSLFAGIGGLDRGLEAVGCTTAAYSEIDPYASRVMAKHWPDVPNLGDITAIDWEAVKSEHGSFDIICGGFPCQDISLSGKGGGVEHGKRSGLWSNYAEAIRVLRPRGVLVENVAALRSRGLDRVLWDLAAIGYDAEWDCVPASALGAPHARERLFLVAYPNGTQCEGGGLPSGVGQEDADASSGGGPGAGVWPRPLRSTAWEAGSRSASGRTYPPDLLRVAHGVPHRLDRLHCLGNAVVPQVAEHVAKILVDRIK